MHMLKVKNGRFTDSSGREIDKVGPDISRSTAACRRREDRFPCAARRAGLCYYDTLLI